MRKGKIVAEAGSRSRQESAWRHYDAAMLRPYTRSVLPLVAVVAAALALGLPACQNPQGTGGTAQGGGSAPALEPLASAMEGNYSSAEQSKADPDFRDIRLHMKRIWAARNDGPWLYVEQAAAGSLEKPYRQRVYQLATCSDPTRPDGTIESRVFELPGDPLAFAGAWADAARFDLIRVQDLLPRDGCTVFLTASEDGTQSAAWTGATGIDSCPSSLRGASYATSQVTITSTEIRSWDRGFDKDGKQVWGAVTGPYKFIKQADVATPASKSAPTAGTSPAREPSRDRASPF